MSFPILSAILFLPLAGAIAILCIPREKEDLIRKVALSVTGVTLLLTILAWLKFPIGQGGMQFVESISWIPSFGVNYKIGVDGLSFPLIFLTSLLSVLSVLYSGIIRERVKEYFALFLLLQMGMVGVFMALDLFLFYVFWEIGLVPMYFIIGIWGGARKEYAAIKFFLYTLVGSMAMLLAILTLYFGTTPHTLDIMAIASQKPFLTNSLVSGFLFLGFFLAFAIKVPMFPFHTWLPDAHVEAPPAGSVILAGVRLKMGAYGFLRIILPILPGASATFAPMIAILAVISIVYGALVSLAQTDFKKLIAYSSVNHMGYAMLGIASAMALTTAPVSTKALALNGAILQLFNHGIITGALFLLVGVIYERAHTRDLNAFGGLAARVPVFGGFLALAGFASLGLPGLAGFISEFMIFLGSFPIFPLFTILSLIGVVVTAAFLLWTMERILLGKLNPKLANTPEMDRREIWSVAPLGVAMVILGIFPEIWINMTNPTVMKIMTEMVATR